MDIKEFIAERSQQRIVEAETGIEEMPVVRFRRLNVGDVLRLTEILERDKVAASIELVALTVVDDNDERVFADADAVRAIDWPTCEALIEAAQSIAEIGKQIEDAGKD